MAERQKTLALATGLTITVERLADGAREGWVRHEGGTRSFFGMSGGLVIHTNEPDHAHALTAGDLYTIPPGVPYCMENDTDNDVEFVSIATGRDYTEIAESIPTVGFRLGAAARAEVPVRKSREALAAAASEAWHRYDPEILRMETIAKGKDVWAMSSTSVAGTASPGTRTTRSPIPSSA